MMKRRIVTGLSLIIALLSPAFTADADMYRVQKGDSLYSISKKQGVSIEAIKKANHLSSHHLKPGQNLTIPQVSKITAQNANTPSCGAATYTIKKGDTLSSISLSTGVPLKQIMALNDVNPKTLRVGRKLSLTEPQLDGHPDTVDMEDEDLSDEDSDESPATIAGMSSDHLIEAPVSNELMGKWNSMFERKLLVRVATGFLGTPYKLGGNSVRGMDCSAYVRKIYEFFDVSLPRTAREQAALGVRVGQNELVEGDLVFFRTRKPIGHVGIYIGNNEFVHASYKAKSVRIDRLDQPYFQKRYRHAIRLKGLDGEDGA
ncbi:MAG: LysM peptidoglycan-binding domain-containing protein [Smithellaceae bacterium]